MNGINPVKINGIAKEVSTKKEVIKEVVEQTTQEVKAQVSNIGRDLVKSARNTSPKISVSELIKDGYKIGESGIVYKMDHKKNLYKSVQFEDGNAINITVENTLTRDHAVISQKLKDGKWISIYNRGESYKMIDGNPSERAIKKATELQFDGYKITAQDEKSLTLNKNDISLNISKSDGNEVK